MIDYSAELWAWLNAYRPRKLPSLCPDPRLRLAARDQAIWIAHTDQAHIQHRPDDSTPLHRALDQGYEPLRISELAYGTQVDSSLGAAAAWAFWLAIPSYRKLLRDPEFTSAGIAGAAGVWGNAWVIVLALESTHARPLARIRAHRPD